MKANDYNSFLFSEVKEVLTLFIITFITASIPFHIMITIFNFVVNELSLIWLKQREVQGRWASKRGQKSVSHMTWIGRLSITC